MSNPGQLSRDYFENILKAVRLVEERSASITTADDFVLSQEGTLILDAIAMRLQVIGELVKKIEKSDPEILNFYKDIEWAMIMRLRDIISHHYEVIDYEIIFDICKNHIPKLKTAVTSILIKPSKKSH